MSIEAMKFARDWIAEKPELRPCSAGKVVSMLTRAIAAAEKTESGKDALLRRALEALENSETTVQYVGFGIKHRQAVLAHLAITEEIRNHLERTNGHTN